MDKSDILLGLYLLKQVMVTLKDSDTRIGILNDADTLENHIQVADEELDLNTVDNLEFVGNITDYHLYRGYGEIEGIEFDLNDVIDDVDKSFMIFGEFDVEVACHLCLRDCKIRANDIRVLKSVHRINPYVLERADFLYRMKDGSVEIGIYVEEIRDDVVIKHDGIEKKIHKHDIVDITKYPVVNDYVYLSTKNNTIIQGIVSTIKNDKLVIIDTSATMVAVDDIESIRFKGRIKVGVENRNGKRVRALSVQTDGNAQLSFRCKKASFMQVDLHDRIYDDAEVSFIIGISDKGLVPKDVCLVETEDSSIRPVGFGVILFMPQKMEEYGLIGSEYMSKGYAELMKTPQPTGNVRFNKNVIDFDYDFKRGILQVVSYKYNSDSDSNVQYALSVSLIETYSFSDTAYIKVEPDGSVQSLSTSVAYLQCFIDEEVELCFIDGSILRGILKSFSLETLTIITKEDEENVQLINVNSIVKARYCGYVSAYRSDNGTGYIGGKYWFHINDLRKNEEAFSIGSDKKVMFSLVNTNRGNYSMATDISIEKEDTIEGVLVECDSLNCTVYPKDGVDKNENIIKLPYLVLNKSVSENLNSLNTKKYIYPITFSVRKSNNKESLVIYSIDTSKAERKKQYGYLVKYIPTSRGYYCGFIKEESEIDRLLVEGDKTGKYYFHESDIIESPFSIDTRTNYYYVSFVPENDSVAKSIRIIKEIPDPSSVSILKGTQVPNNKIGLQTFPMDCELVKGENFICIGNDHLQRLLVFDKLTEESIYTNEGIIQRKNVEFVIRFGIVTAFNLEKGTAIINRCIEVPLDCFDPKAINILRNQTNGYRLHVVYAWKNRQVSFVTRIEDNVSQLVKWEEGIVTLINDDKSILIDDSAVHYTSVLTDGMVNRMVKSGSIVNKKVYVKKIKQSIFDESTNAIVLCEAVFEIRVDSENATIQYDQGNDRFLAYRNPTVYYPVGGNIKLLSKYVNQETQIKFEICNDGYSLEAKLADLYSDNNGYDEDDFEDDFEDDSEENQTLESLLSEEIVKFCEERLDLRSKGLTGVTLNEYGLPMNTENAKKAFDSLISRNVDSYYSIAAAVVVKNYPDVLPDKTTGDKNAEIAKRFVNAFKQKCQRLAVDSNYCAGELAYYLSTLLKYPIKRIKNRNTLSTNECLYLLFALDFLSREEINNFGQIKKQVENKSFSKLFARKCKSSDELLSHLIMLDQTHLEKVSDIIEKNDILLNDIRQAIIQIDKDIEGSRLYELVKKLREQYRRLKNNFSNDLSSLIKGENVAFNVNNTIKQMQVRFLRMICEDDRGRFNRVYEACSVICNYTQNKGFDQQEEALISAYRELSEVESDIIEHPCKESCEILFLIEDNDGNNTIDLLKYEIEELLGKLYNDATSEPRIRCIPNEMNLEREQKTFFLIVENGDSNTKIRPAKNIVLHLESFTEGVSVEREIKPDNNKPLLAGEQTQIEVQIEYETDVETDVMTIGWEIEYEQTIAFNDGKKESEKQSIGDSFELQVGAISQVDKEKHYENPYHNPALGEPLKDNTMFYGRQEETKEVLNSFISENNGVRHLIPGSAVIIYGQKKSGKTSLVNQIKNSIKEDSGLNDKAIIINFDNILDTIGGPETLPYFKRNFYANIISQFKHEIRRNHRDVCDLLKANNIEIPDILSNKESWAAQFDAFFRDFFEIDQSKHTIILFMDEFTLLSTEIMKAIKDPQNNSLATIPNFIKTFSQYGFIQVIIGHEAMMRALDRLGVRNHTAEFAKTIEIGALDLTASKQLVVEPMKNIFGFDVYSTPMGGKAIDLMLDLSGCNPTFLMRLCDKMFDFYVGDNCHHSQIIYKDVDNMVREYVDEMMLEDFDILLVEDGDEIQDPIKRKTYIYLKVVAILANSNSFDGRTADINQVKQELRKNYMWETALIEEVQSILEARRVISITSGGRLKINTGLFQKYIVLKEGLTV